MSEPLAAKGREWLRIEPDKKYDIGWADVRFEIPIGISWELMIIMAKPTIEKSIGLFERLGHWKFYDKIPIQYRVSPIATQGQLDYMNSLPKPELAFTMDPGKPGSNGGYTARDAGEYDGNIGMSARVFFIRPLDVINLDEEQEYREATQGQKGFVAEADMPKGSMPDDDPLKRLRGIYQSEPRVLGPDGSADERSDEGASSAD